MTRHAATRILHRLSEKAGLPRKIGPHALRHYADTSILKQTGDLEFVRQVLRHESLAMALRYAHLTKPDISAKFRRASPLDNLRAGRLKTDWPAGCATGGTSTDGAPRSFLANPDVVLLLRYRNTARRLIERL